MVKTYPREKPNRVFPSYRRNKHVGIAENTVEVEVGFANQSQDKFITVRPRRSNSLIWKLGLFPSSGIGSSNSFGVSIYTSIRGVAVGSTEDLKKAIQEQFPKENEVCMKYFIIAYVIN
ncbi:hypothetical protein QQ045_003238 [Rhodiola kirilowii]